MSRIFWYSDKHFVVQIYVGQTQLDLTLPNPTFLQNILLDKSNLWSVGQTCGAFYIIWTNTVSAKKGIVPNPKQELVEKKVEVEMVKT